MRRRILLLTLGVTTLVVLAFVIPLAILIGRETAARATDDLERQAQYTAFDGVRSTSSAADVGTYLADADDANGTSTLVILGDGTRVGSLPAAVTGFATGGPVGSGGYGGGGPGGPPGAVGDVPGGKLAFGFNRDNGARVFVFASTATVSGGADGWFALLAGASLALLLLAAIASVVVSRRISAPLTATAAAAHELSVGRITARAPVDGPREVAEVGTALNRLAGRIDELIGEERETVADLSHRLRTPLTALRLDADALGDPAEAERIGEHVATLERTLTAVIHAARRPEREGLAPACDATAVVGERTGFWSALAEDQGRSVTLALPSTALPVRAAATDLAAAVDALLENVVAHTPEGTAFAVTLADAPDGAVLVVADDGPGIPVGAGVRGRSDRGSTGLGLSIAAHCAENSGGFLVVEPPGAGGGVVRMVLGRP